MPTLTLTKEELSRLLEWAEHEAIAYGFDSTDTELQEKIQALAAEE